MIYSADSAPFVKLTHSPLRTPTNPYILWKKRTENQFKEFVILHHVQKAIKFLSTPGAEIGMAQLTELGMDTSPTAIMAKQCAKWNLINQKAQNGDVASLEILKKYTEKHEMEQKVHKDMSTKYNL